MRAMQRYTVRLLCAFLAFCLGICLFKTVNVFEEHYYPVTDINSVTVPTADSPELNEIYNVLLGTLKDAHVKPLVVQSESESYIYIDYSPTAPNDSDPHDKFAKTVQEFMPDVQTETLKNFLDENEHSGPIRISAPDLNVALMPPPDFSNRNFWTTFYKTYPNSSGLIFLSKVGFNNRHDQALVYVARTCGGLCGVGSYFLLGKANGKWIFLRDEVLYVS